MARIDYPETDRPELAELVARIEAGRGGKLLNLYRMLLHSPVVAEGWLQLASAIRMEASLDGRSRELAICLVARLTGCTYEWLHHAPLAQREGLDPAALDALPAWRQHQAFSESDRAVLGYAEALTVGVEADAATFAAVSDAFDDRALVELTATIGYYACVARFLMALGVDFDDNPGVPPR